PSYSSFVTHYYHWYPYHLALCSVPTRRSSDLCAPGAAESVCAPGAAEGADTGPVGGPTGGLAGSSTGGLVGSSTGGLVGSPTCGDRKSTRLNSSHVSISYAVFCLRKKHIIKTK